MLKKKHAEITAKIIMYIIVTAFYFGLYLAVWNLVQLFILNSRANAIEVGLLLMCGFLSADARLVRFENSKLKNTNKILTSLRYSYNELLRAAMKESATRNDSFSSTPNEDRGNE